MLEFISKGGVLVIPIGLCSVVALAVFLERLVFFIRVRKGDKGLVKRLVHLTHEKKIPEAVKTAESSQNPLGRLLTEMLSVRDCDEKTQQAAVREAYAQESRGLASRLQLLATIANIAPLLGLLGTVTGMIKAFMVIQQTGGKVDAAALGLAVALPVMMAHSYLLSCVETEEAHLKNGIVRYLKGTETL